MDFSGISIITKSINILIEKIIKKNLNIYVTHNFCNLKKNKSW